MTTSSTKRIFIALSSESIVDDISFLGRGSHKLSVGDVLYPTLNHHFKKFDTTEVTFIGQNADQIGFVDQFADDHVTKIYCYAIADSGDALAQAAVASIQNIIGSHSFDDKILLPGWQSCLLFTKDRLQLKISLLTCGQNFREISLEYDLLVLDECRRTSPAVACISDNGDLLTIVQPYTGSVYSSITVDCIQVTGGISPGGGERAEIGLRHLSRKLMEIGNSAEFLGQFYF